jgi:hypothetical protein
MKKIVMKDNMIGKNFSISDTAEVSDLSGETTFDNSVTLTETNTTNNTNYVSATKSNIGGRKRGQRQQQRLQRKSFGMKP